MSRERRLLSVRNVEIVSEGSDAQAMRLKEPRQSLWRVKRDMSVARTGVPPVQTDRCEIFGLKKRGEQDCAGLLEQRGHGFDGGLRCGHMFEDFEAGDQVEALGRQLIEAR